MLFENEYFRAYKQAQRREDDIAIVNSAFYIQIDEKSNKVSSLRMAYGGMSFTTKMALKSAEKLIGWQVFTTLFI